MEFGTNFQTSRAIGNIKTACKICCQIAVSAKQSSLTIGMQVLEFNYYVLVDAMVIGEGRAPYMVNKATRFCAVSYHQN